MFILCNKEVLVICNILIFLQLLSVEAAGQPRRLGSQGRQVPGERRTCSPRKAWWEEVLTRPGE